VDGRDGTDGRDGVDGRDGTDGADGVGIANVEGDAVGNITVTLTDGSEYTVEAPMLSAGSDQTIIHAGGQMPSYDVNDIGPALRHVEREILSTYGDKVSFAAKAKSLNKFGRNTNLADVRETVWETGGEEVYATANTIDSIVSTEPTDATIVKVEGHTVTGTGQDAQYTFVVQEITLNGTTPVILPTPLARVSRAYNNNAIEFGGTITVYESGNNVVHITVDPADNQSFKAATTFSNTDYFALSHLEASVTRKQTATVDFFLQIRAPGKVFRTVYEITATQASGTIEATFDPPVIVPKNHDVRVTAVSTVAGTGVNAAFGGYIATVV